MIRAVIDTNVLVSALISPGGNEALLLLAVKQGLVRPCFSRAVLKEYSEVLPRAEFGFSADEIRAVIDLFKRQGELFYPARAAWSYAGSQRGELLNPITLEL